MAGNPMDDALEGMESVLKRPQATTEIPILRGVDWFSWRKLHSDLWIGRTGEDGSLEDWQSLLRLEGPHNLTSAVIQCRRTMQKGSRIRLQDVLAALPCPQTEDQAPDASWEAEERNRSKRDLLIWCVVHSPICYADARCQWVDGEGTVERDVPGYGKIKVKERICRQGTTMWEQLRDRAAEAQTFIFKELGKPIDAIHKPSVYHTVQNDPRMIAWIRSQKLIP